jgi:hypothetical protein
VFKLVVSINPVDSIPWLRINILGMFSSKLYFSLESSLSTSFFRKTPYQVLAHSININISRVILEIISKPYFWFLNKFVNILWD